MSDELKFEIERDGVVIYEKNGRVSRLSKHGRTSWKSGGVLTKLDMCDIKKQ